VFAEAEAEAESSEAASHLQHLPLVSQLMSYLCGVAAIIHPQKNYICEFLWQILRNKEF
jgi:hypothetical protein